MRNGDSCYCQKSNGEEVTAERAEAGSAYDTCRVVPNAHPPAVEEPVVAPTSQFQDGCQSDWIRTNFFGPGELLIGMADSPAGCVTKGIAECPEG